MTKPLTLRGWATPRILGAFVLMAGTGVVMFFKFDTGVMAPVHRLSSWIFLVAAGRHIAANVRPFKNHLKSTLGMASAGVFGCLLIFSFGSWGVMTTPQLLTSLEETLAGAPLTAVAAVKQMSPDLLITGLHQHGIVASPGQTLHAIAKANHITDRKLFTIVMTAFPPAKMHLLP
jgi:hypothetical protein